MKCIIGLIGVGVLWWTFETAVWSQESVRVWKIGQLISGSASLHTSRDQALRNSLTQLGYTEGKNIVMEYRYAEGKLDQLDQLARALVEQKPDAIIVWGTRVTGAVKKATKTIPIVVIGASDLVEAGLINSYMYPGNNITGVVRLSPDVFGMRLKLTKEVLPKLTQVAVLSNPNSLRDEVRAKDFELTAKAQGLRFRSVKASTVDEMDEAIEAVSKGGADVLFPMRNALFNNNVSAIARLAIRNRLATVYDQEGFVQVGGLMRYGVNLDDLSRKGADYIVKILGGNKLQALTLVESMKFDLSVNLKTASQIGVTIPPEIIQRAVKIVE